MGDGMPAPVLLYRQLGGHHSGQLAECPRGDHKVHLRDTPFQIAQRRTFVDALVPRQLVS